MGFVLDVEPMMCVDLFYKIVRICPKAIKYGAPLLETKQIKRVGIMAGMISSIEQLAQIELCCDICVCGDLFIRDNSRRYIDMEKAIAQSSIPYICLSHNISESQVFMYGLFPLLKSFFPSLLFCEVQNSQFR
jgi:hypothetical protein